MVVKIIETTDGKFIGQEVEMPKIGDMIGTVMITFVTKNSFGSSNYVFQFKAI